MLLLALGAVIVAVAALVAVALVVRNGTVEELQPIPTEPAPSASITYGQEARANWDVTGIAAGDTLNVRTGPGVGNQVIATLTGSTAELESTGRIARVAGALWREIIVPGDGTGWVSAQYLTETAPPA
jgi:uncharacterized protein YgiM (DUF1202 family)